MKFERTPYGDYAAWDGKGNRYLVKHESQWTWFAGFGSQNRKRDKFCNGCGTKREAVAICELWAKIEMESKS